MPPESPLPSTTLPGFRAFFENSLNGSELKLTSPQPLVIPWSERVRHWMIVGKTGGGKTSRLLLPMLFADIADPERTVVVIDAQLSLARSVMEFTRAKRGAGARLLYFNPSDPRASISWNPLSGIESRSEAYDLASMMASAIAPQSGSDSPYFLQQATLKLCFLFLAINQVTHGNGTLQQVRDVVDGGVARLEALARVAQSAELESFAREVATGNKNTETVLGEIANILLAWQDDDVCQTTSASDFNFDQLERRPHVFLLGLPEEKVQRLRPLTNAFLHRFFEFVMSRGQARGGQLRRPFVLFADEFASAVGKLPDFPVRANTLRKRGLAITAAVQTVTQLHDVYGTAASSLEAAFNHWVFVPPLAQADAQWAANQSGLTTVNELVTGPAGEVLSVNPVTRPVLTPDEVARPPRDEALGPKISFLLADSPPFQGYLPGAWENPEWSPFMKQGVPFRPRSCRRRSTPLVNVLSLLGGATSSATGFTDTTGWPPAQLRARIEDIKNGCLDWPKTSGSPRAWWEKFEAENELRLSLVLRLCEEIQARHATITEFFMAYVYSNTDNIQANLHYLDYTRLKQEEMKRKREVAQSESQPNPALPYVRCKTCDSLNQAGATCRVCQGMGDELI